VILQTAIPVKILDHFIIADEGFSGPFLKGFQVFSILRKSFSDGIVHQF